MSEKEIIEREKVAEKLGDDWLNSDL